MINFIKAFFVNLIWEVNQGLFKLICIVRRALLCMCTLDSVSTYIDGYL